MKICLAQTHSRKGRIDENLPVHLQLIDKAAASGADLILFPELSLTNYQPALARALAIDPSDAFFVPLQAKSNELGMTIIAGMPTRAAEGVHISALIFRPGEAVAVYSKQLLHADELPYFIPGLRPGYFEWKGKKMAVGICYESLQPAHVQRACEGGADIYLASVAKPQRGIEKAYPHFCGLSKIYPIPVCMVNCVGPCEGFIGAGQSAVWEGGVLKGKLNDTAPGMLLYDTDRREVFSIPST